jgi:hypothetical protein
MNSRAAWLDLDVNLVLPVAELEMLHRITLVDRQNNVNASSSFIFDSPAQCIFQIMLPCFKPSASTGNLLLKLKASLQ